jgi:hypothetical protein
VEDDIPEKKQQAFLLFNLLSIRKRYVRYLTFYWHDSIFMYTSTTPALSSHFSITLKSQHISNDITSIQQPHSFGTTQSRLMSQPLNVQQIFTFSVVSMLSPCCKRDKIVWHLVVKFLLQDYLPHKYLQFTTSTNPIHWPWHHYWTKLCFVLCHAMLLTMGHTTCAHNTFTLIPRKSFSIRFRTPYAMVQRLGLNLGMETDHRGKHFM